MQQSPGAGAQQRLAVLAFLEELAGVDGHDGHASDQPHLVEQRRRAAIELKARGLEFIEHAAILPCA